MTYSPITVPNPKPIVEPTALSPHRGSAVSHLIETSGFFIPQVSLARMSEIVSGKLKTERVVVGSGCVHTDGVSAGVPVDTIAFYAAAALMARAAGLNKLTILIAPAIAKANENIDLNDPHTAAQLLHIEKWHSHIATQFKNLCADVGIETDIIMDRDVMTHPAYQTARRERQEACRGIEGTVCPYSEWQDLIFRTLQMAHDAGIKVGWTPHTDEDIGKQYPHIFNTLPEGNVTLAGRLAIANDKRVQGACEVAFDTNIRAFWFTDPIQACYIPSALTLDGKTVAPYTAKPRNGSGWHGRILLTKDGHEDLQSVLRSAALKHPQVLLGFIRQCQTIDAIFPSLQVGLFGDEISKVDELFTQRQNHFAAIKTAPLEDQKANMSEAKRRERYTNSNEAFAEYTSEIVSKRLGKLIDVFGIYRI